MPGDTPLTSPVVFAYDGSDLARAAIDEAGRQLRSGRDALVLTVWQPFNVGFVPPPELQLDAAQTQAVRHAAEQTAADGATLAQAAGFRAQGLATETAPTWKGIVEPPTNTTPGSSCSAPTVRSGLADVMIGSVAGTVAAHSRRPVLIVHRPG
jgi:nucleotide-binding universal stress UspA family protein